MIIPILNNNLVNLKYSKGNEFKIDKLKSTKLQWKHHLKYLLFLKILVL